MAEIEKPSEVTQIPIAPGIKLENLIQFDGDCIDPVALVIIIESLDYCLETSARRLRSAGRIFSGVEESAYSGGKGILPVIRAVREALLSAPQCTPTGPQVKPPPIPPEEAIVAEAKRRTAETAPVSKVEELKKVQEKVSSAKTTEELFQAVKGHPELERAIIEATPAGKAKLKVKKKKAAPKPKEAPPKKERELPGLWGSAYYEGKEYESPQALAKELGILTRGARNMVIAFERAGFEVKGDAEKVEKGKTGFVVRRVKPTPAKYKIPVEKKEEVPVLPPPKEEWLEIRNVKGELIAWEPLDPDTGEAIVERRIWVSSGEKPPVEASGLIVIDQVEANSNPKRKYPITWDIRIEHPDVDSPKWESYKRLIEHFKQRKLRGRSAPGTGTVVIENVPTPTMVEELTSLIRSYDLKVIDIVTVEQIPELGNEEE